MDDSRTSVKDGHPLHLEREEFGKAAEVADDFWVIATHHHPGMSKHMFEINNRCLVVRVHDRDAGKRVLAVVNAVDPAQAIGEVRRLERETGAAVAYIISPGGGHHMTIEPWHDEFTAARVLIGPVRIPRIAHGQRLMQLPRVATMNLDDPLPQFRGELDAVIFHGLLGPRDVQTAGEGAPDTRWGLITGMLRAMPPKDPVDELWLHHVATDTVIGGENLGWYYPTEAIRKEPFLLRRMVKPDQVWIQSMARRVGEAGTVADCWRRVLEWPCQTLMTYHDAATTAFVGDGRAALTQAARASKQIPAT